MKITLLLSLVLLASCGARRPGKLGKAGTNGASASVEVTDVAPGTACFSGGLAISTYTNSILTQTKVVCNGINGNAGADGQDGSNGSNGTSASVSLENIAPGSVCANGGTRISSSTSINSQVICNGTNGLAGIDGENGTDGAAGTLVLPVKFCTSDNSNYPEYGLLIGSDLYAVYWGSTPSSSSAQAFLTKLTPGNYQSTGGNNCQFTIH